MNAFTPLFPLFEHKRILAATIDEYDQKLEQTVTKVVHEQYKAQSTIAYDEMQKEYVSQIADLQRQLKEALDKNTNLEGTLKSERIKIANEHKKMSQERDSMAKERYTSRMEL